MCLTKEENIQFGNELEALMERYPKSKVFVALNMAVRNLKSGRPANYTIRTDWDKYGDFFDPFGDMKNFSQELKDLCIKYGILHSDGHSWAR